MKIIKFYTPTCMPCKAVGKILEKIGNLDITEVNALEDIALVDKYNVCMTPTLIFLKENEEVGRISGMTTEAKIRELLNS